MLDSLRDATDRQQQSSQQQFITAVAAVNLRTKTHKHQTRATEL